MIDLFRNGSIAAEEFYGILSHISNTLTSADALLNDILQWAASHQENGVERESINLKDLPISILNSNTLEFNRKKNQVKNLVPNNVQVTFDKNILTFVLRNLLLNANKFTEGGTISIESMHQKDSLILSVTDTGQGMSSEQLDQLFNWRKRNSTVGTQGEKGSGLALLLSRDLLMKNGAEILVESRKGEGSTFSIVLPA
ncbi:MAG TPA: HAMP domain-containing sensor histidine kinase [Cyclobacteriaceae bacterium]